MKYKRLSKLYGYVVTASHAFRHHSSLATEKFMNFIPSTAGAKLGLASTFMFGAAISFGNQLKKYKDTEAQSTNEEGRNLHVTGNLTRSFTDQKHCDIVTKIHKTLKSYQLTSTDESALVSFYVERAEKSCHTYLSSQGVIEPSAKFLLEKWYEDLEWIDDTSHLARLPYVRYDEPSSYPSTLYASVTALWHISSVRECIQMKGFVTTSLLQMLKEILEEKDGAVTPLVLKIIANISAMGEYQQDLHESGMVDFLMTYSENSRPELFLPAWRGLHNLKQWSENNAVSREIYEEGLYPFVPPYFDKAENPVIDVVLVHGIMGKAEWTWRQHDKEKVRPLVTQDQRRSILTGQHKEDMDELYTCCWPLDWLVPALGIPIRVLAVDYDANWRTSMDKFPIEGRGKALSEHARNVAESLKAARVGDRPIVWICHSYGGLIVKYMLVNGYPNESVFNEREFHLLQEDCVPSSNSLARKSLGVVFFSVPHHGAPISGWVAKPGLRQLLCPSTEICQTKTDSSELCKLHQSFVDLVRANGTTVLTFNEALPMIHGVFGLDVYFVPSKYGDPGIGTVHDVDANHLDICKPLNRKSVLYQKVASFFQDVIKNL